MEAKVKIKYKDGTVEEKKYSSQEKYDKKNTKQYRLKLNLNTDIDIIEWMDRQESKQGAIKRLIRSEIKSTKAKN